MEHLNDMGQTPEIEYPCEWKYRLIALSQEHILEAVEEVIHTRRQTLTKSNESKNGKYISYSLAVIVDCEEDRNNIFKALKSHPKIVMVL